MPLGVDEFQHNHAAWLVSTGQKPYVDFFEHHTPLYYYLASACVDLKAGRFDSLIHTRYLSLSAFLFGGLVGFFWLRRHSGEAAAWIWAALAASEVPMFYWSQIVFLDCFSAPLLLLAAGALSEKGRFTTHAYAVAGVAIGLAVGFNIKALMAGPALAAWFAADLIRCRSDEDGFTGFRLRWSAFALGGMATLLLLLVLLGPRSLAASWDAVISTNTQWRARRLAYREVSMLFSSHPLISAIATAAVATHLRSLVKRMARLEARDLPLLFLLSLVFGIFILPVVWIEYFVNLLPFVLLLAADFVARLLQKVADAAAAAPGVATRLDAAHWTGLAAGAAALMPFDRLAHRSDDTLLQIGTLYGLFFGCLLAGFMTRRHWRGVLAGFAAAQWMISSRGSGGSTLDWKAMAAIAGVAGILLILAPLRWCRAVCLFLAVASLVLIPMISQVRAALDPGGGLRLQRAKVEFINAETPPNGTVFDGYSGYGVFRKHAYRYWFLHEETQQMLSAEEKHAGILNSLRTAQPRIVIVDGWTKLLPAEVLEYIGRNYRESQFTDIRVRR